MNIGILWDIENVAPPAGTDYVQAIVDEVSKEGRLSYAMAFGDWSEKRLSSIAPELASNNFELIHTPHTRGKKNSTDMSLIARGVEIIFQFPHIDKYVLISGDGDFRPLLLAQKKHGKQTCVICDINNNASDDLIHMADQTLDYRDIIKSSADIDDEQELSYEQSDNHLSKEKAFELFKETIGMMKSQKKKPTFGGVKSRMKLYNEQFDEVTLGYSTWSSFVADAKKAMNIAFSDKDGAFVLNEDADTMPEVFRALVDALPKSSQEWMNFGELGKSVSLKNTGYKKLKDLALDAEKRGYVETRNEGLTWFVRRSKAQSKAATA